MRGESCAHLMLADDDWYYVVKFSNNPQHRRVLINELICYELLDALHLPNPGWSLVGVPQSLIDADPALFVGHGQAVEPCAAGLQFGARYPVDPSKQAVYDYVPAAMLEKLQNRAAFIGMLAFDKWVNNNDTRQAVFYRGKAALWPHDGPGPVAQPAPNSLVYGASFIDHGLAFGGGQWGFTDLPSLGFFPNWEVYTDVCGLASFEPWLSRIENLPSGVLDAAYRKIPADWYAGEADALEHLLEQLYRRRSKIRGFLLEAKAMGASPFPNWSSSALLARAGG